MPSFLDYALDYAARGWKVFPLQPHSKEPFSKEAFSVNGQGGFKVASSEPEAVRAMWKRNPEANIGVSTGACSGIVVLDVDPEHGGDQSLMNIQVEWGKFPRTLSSKTGGGGMHILFAHPGVEIRNSAGKLGEGLDIRGDGGYIVAPPSIHPSGNAYCWLNAGVDLAPMPDWMVEKLREKPAEETGVNVANPAIPRAVPVGPKIRAGARNQTLASLAGTMRRRGLDADAILAALYIENDRKCDPPLSHVEVERIANSVARYTPKDEPKYEPPIEAREPLSAEQGVVQFLELLDNLEGRSIPTHIIPLDAAIGGLERQTLTVLAARPSMGKSTLAWQIARNVAAGKKISSFFSMEMSATSLWAKAACGVCGIRWRDVRNQKVGPADLERIKGEALGLADVYGKYLLVDDGMNTADTIWLHLEKYHPDLVVVDHLRLMSDKNEDEVKRLGVLTNNLKQMAKVFNCATLCLAQLNRGVEKQENKRPQMSDLRDSGQIEENADLILMMYRDDYYNMPEVPPAVSKTEILIRKYRDDINSQRVILWFDTRHQWFGEKPPDQSTQSESRTRRGREDID